MKPYRLTVTLDYPIEEDGPMSKVVCSGRYTPGSPGTMYARNGDPGDPPEPPEFDFRIDSIDGENPDAELAAILMDDDDLADAVYEAVGKQEF